MTGKGWALAGLGALVVAGAAVWILLHRGAPASSGKTSNDAAASPSGRTLPDGITILSDGNGAADPRFEPVDGNPAALVVVTEPDGRRGVLLFGLGDPGSAGFVKNLRPALADRGVELARARRAAVVFSHFHFNIFPPASAGSRPPYPPLDLLPAPLKALPAVAIQGPNLASLCKLNRPSGHLMGTCGRAPRDTAPGVAPLQWSDGPSQKIHLLTYAFSPPLDQERVSGIALTPMETVLIIATPPSGYVVFAYCSHMQAAPGGVRPVFHAASLVKQAMAAGKLAPGPIHTLLTGTCDVSRTLSTRRAAAGGRAGEVDQAGAQEAARQLRAELKIKRLYLVHCGLTGGAGAAFGAPLAYPGAVIPLKP